MEYRGRSWACVTASVSYPVTHVQLILQAVAHKRYPSLWQRPPDQQVSIRDGGGDVLRRRGDRCGTNKDPEMKTRSWSHVTGAGKQPAYRGCPRRMCWCTPTNCLPHVCLTERRRTRCGNDSESQTPTQLVLNWTRSQTRSASYRHKCWVRGDEERMTVRNPPTADLNAELSESTWCGRRPGWPGGGPGSRNSSGGSLGISGRQNGMRNCLQWSQSTLNPSQTSNKEEEVTEMQDGAEDVEPGNEETFEILRGRMDRSCRRQSGRNLPLWKDEKLKTRH